MQLRFPDIQADHIAQIGLFEEMVLQQSKKQGVDVIFNVLSGTILTASLRFVPLLMFSLHQ